MGPNKGRRVGKIEVPTDTPAEFEFGDMAADIQREKREARERHKEREKARKEETTHSAEVLVAEAFKDKQK